MLLTFAVTLFVSAFRLFNVKPLVATRVTPLLGGTPAVWNACMVFFQAALLLGYSYSHVTTKVLRLRKQAFVHLGLLAAALVLLLLFPLTINQELLTGRVENPVVALLLILTLSVGVPFFVVSTTASLLQKWFAESGHPSAEDPYFLYGASNLGSLLALVSYPALVEPYLTLTEQRFAWVGGFALLAALIGACALFLWQTPGKPAGDPKTASEPLPPVVPPVPP